MVKNTGIPENQLSNLDYPQVLQDSHNIPLHALDVNVINSLVPERYSKVEYTFKDMDDGTQETEFITFYGDGSKQVSNIKISDDFLGTYQITTLFILNQTPQLLDGKYFVIYDDIGSVGVWFNLNGNTSQPTTNTDRNIEINILSNDNNTTIASKISTVLNSDSKFSSNSLTSTVVIQSNTIGSKTESNVGTTNLSILNTVGKDNINNTYFYLNSAKDEREYYIWFNYELTGIDPLIQDKIGIEIPFSFTDTIETLTQRVSNELSSNQDFNSETIDNVITITNVRFGQSTEITDVNSNSEVETITQGSTGEIVVQIQVIFDENNFITSFERVI